MLAKIDLSKAYNRLEWPLIDLVLRFWGFSYSFRKIVYGCFSLVHYNLLIIGNVVGDLTPTRSLRQEVPLSPYLFILYMDVLSRLLKVNK